MAIRAPIVGIPGVKTRLSALHRLIFRDDQISGFLSQGRLIDGTKASDPGNTIAVDTLRAGNLMGKITTGGLYGSSIIGPITIALTSAGTTVTAAAATITELVRRFGATGTFKVTGPTSANAAGTVRSLTATYSATGATTATITALGVNEVQTVNFNLASTGGNVVLQVPKANGVMITTTPIAWNATDATYLASINTALDTATGVSGGIVATAISAVDTDLGFVLTFSGTGYAGLPQALVDVRTLPTSSTSYNVVRTTTGVSGAFASGSFIQPTDGSETPRTFIPDGYGVPLSDLTGTRVTVQFPDLPLAGVITPSQLLPVWPSDTALRQWIVDQLDANGEGKWVFDHTF